MGGVEAIAPKISEAVAPAPRRRARPTGQVSAAARSRARHWTGVAHATAPQSHDTEEVRSLRELKAQAEMELEDARAVVEQADADISHAEAQFAAGKILESALDVRAPASAVWKLFCLTWPHLLRRRSPPRMLLRRRFMRPKGSTMRRALLSKPRCPRRLSAMRIASAFLLSAAACCSQTR